jgi:hypothetical protein
MYNRNTKTTKENDKNTIIFLKEKPFSNSNIKTPNKNATISVRLPILLEIKKRRKTEIKSVINKYRFVNKEIFGYTFLILNCIYKMVLIGAKNLKQIKKVLKNIV